MIDFLKNPTGQCLYPITLASAVYNLSNSENIEVTLNRLEHVTNVRLYASGWTGSSAPYSQTVNVSNVTSNMNPILVSALEDGASVDTQKAYMKAFAIISSGTGITGNGYVTFKVYQKPTINITVGLKGV